MKNLTKQQYYQLMCNFKNDMSFEEIHTNWYKCFSYILKSFCKEYTDNVIKSLFYDFTMDNWKAMHKENSIEYKDYDKPQLIKAFCGECNYISDRTSYDRLFRTHWLFIHSFEDELNKIKYPNLYK